MPDIAERTKHDRGFIALLATESLSDPDTFFKRTAAAFEDGRAAGVAEKLELDQRRAALSVGFSDREL